MKLGEKVLPGKQDVARRVIVVATIAALAVSLVSCSPLQEEGACALGFVRNGQTYHPYEAPEPVRTGRSIGNVQSVTCAEGDDLGEMREAVVIRGVDPDIAFVVSKETNSTVFAPGPADGSRMAPEVQELLDEGR